MIIICTNNSRRTRQRLRRNTQWKLSFGKKKKLTVIEGETIDLFKLLKIDPKNAVVDLKWKSSGKKTATVDENGVVTGLKKGTVTITVKDAVSGLEATVKIQVKKAKKK